MPLAEQLQREDITKSRLQLETEAVQMIECMQIIQLINRYDDGEGFGTMLRRKIAGLFNDLRKRFGWSGAPHLV